MCIRFICDDPVDYSITVCSLIKGEDPASEQHQLTYLMGDDKSLVDDSHRIDVTRDEENRGNLCDVVDILNYGNHP